MVTTIAASCSALWDATPPGWQAVVFVAGALMALVCYSLFLDLIDRVFADVWAPDWRSK